MLSAGEVDMTQWARRGRHQRRVALWGLDGWLDAVAAEDGALVLLRREAQAECPPAAMAPGRQPGENDDKAAGAEAP